MVFVADIFNLSILPKWMAELLQMFNTGDSIDSHILQDSGMMIAMDGERGYAYN